MGHDEQFYELYNKIATHNRECPQKSNNTANTTPLKADKGLNFMPNMDQSSFFWARIVCEAIQAWANSHHHNPLSGKLNMPKIT